jgi:ribosomal protein S18 acetylase RimI-like enzyme
VGHTFRVWDDVRHDTAFLTDDPTRLLGQTLCMTSGSERVRLEPVSHREGFVSILLEADESEPVLLSYLHDGDLYAITEDGDVIGAVLVIPQGDGLEIKNVALIEAHRSRGLGRATIEAVAEVARRSGAARLTVGTADVSLGTIAFYRRVGFRDVGRIEGFFDAYPDPVIEDGIVAHDMIRLEMEL